jgi:hypothetical protein
MMMRNQTRNFGNLAMQFFRQYCAGTGDPGVLLACPPAGSAATESSGSWQSHHLNRDEEGE